MQAITVKKNSRIAAGCVISVINGANIGVGAIVVIVVYVVEIIMHKLVDNKLNK